MASHTRGRITELPFLSGQLVAVQELYVYRDQLRTLMGVGRQLVAAPAPVPRQHRLTTLPDPAGSLVAPPVLYLYSD